jgi:chromosome segregation ATPase
MDLQVSQGFVNNHANNYNVIICVIVFTLSICAFTAIDYIKLKKELKLENEKNYIIIGEFEKYRRLVRDLETHILGLEGKIGNITKNANTALEQQLDYVNRQLLIQNGTIEDLNAKIVYETDESRSRLLRTAKDIKSEILEEMEKLESHIESQIEELEEGQSFVSNKVDDVHASLTEKLAEKNHMDKQVVREMYQYLYFGNMEGSINEMLQGFFKQFYGFEFEQKINPITDKMLNESHPVRIKRFEFSRLPNLPY